MAMKVRKPETAAKASDPARVAADGGRANHKGDQACNHRNWKFLASFACAGAAGLVSLKNEQGASGRQGYTKTGAVARFIAHRENIEPKKVPQERGEGDEDGHRRRANQQPIWRGRD